jgi:peptidoglycan/LPS O-acetylase OafA/YrhL
MRHMPQLDGLRAFAVLGVIASHSCEAPVFHEAGDFGVRLFFVLSGFLITGILLGCRDLDPGTATRAFYCRRALRIFPLYFATLIAFTFVLPFAGMDGAFWWNATYLSNFRNLLTGHDLGPAGHFWTLAVEEQFYLLWPSVILFTPARYLRTVLVASVVIGPVARLATICAGIDPLVGRFATPCVLDSLCGGALLALMRSAATPSVLRKIACAGIAVTALAWSVPSEVVAFVARDTGFALLSVFIVGTAAAGFSGIVGRTLMFRPIAYVGTISYGIYVLHQFVPPIGTRLQRLIGIDMDLASLGFSRFVFVTIASIAVAAVSWHFFESPLNDLKRYFPYRGRPKVAVEPEPVVA